LSPAASWSKVALMKPAERECGNLPRRVRTSGSRKSAACTDCRAASTRCGNRSECPVPPSGQSSAVLPERPRRWHNRPDRGDQAARQVDPRCEPGCESAKLLRLSLNTHYQQRDGVVKGLRREMQKVVRLES